MMNQMSLPTFCPVTQAVDRLAANGRSEERGAVFTRREVVDFILDLSGYTADRPLHTMRLLEPSVGEGDFLIPVLDRLVAAFRYFAPDGDPAVLADAIRVVEINKAAFAEARRRVLSHLGQLGFSSAQAESLASAWLIQGDFLLSDLGATRFHFCVGNPPYVRIENIEPALQDEYRRRFRTLYDRADLYVAFMERSLSLLGDGGVLGFIVSDRWTKNKYGGPLRAMIGGGFRLRHFVDMVNTPAFLSDVIAYPAIFIIAREDSGPTTVAHRPAIEAQHLSNLAKELLGKNPGAVTIKQVAIGSEPWILEEFERLAILRNIEKNFPLIEDVGCKIMIGVATGSDAVFIGRYDDLDVEADRKLPLVMTRDIKDGALEPRGMGVLNPYENNGKLVDLRRYPKLAAHFERHRAALEMRHVAKKIPAQWYKTIDKITPSLTYRPKLLIPDIKGSANVVYEPGQHYVHHNIYYILSSDWDLCALRAVLLSKLTSLFVTAYSVKMRGNFLRFQAQYLRRIRLPNWQSVSQKERARLAAAGLSGDTKECNAAAFALYGLTEHERAIIQG